MTERSAHAHQARQRRMLIGVALMFFAPLTLAFFLYYGTGWHPGGRVNAGELIVPARPLPALALPIATGDARTNPDFLKGKWTLLYVQKGRCDDECGKHLYDTRQVRLALDHEMDRVQRVFIGDADCCNFQELKQAHPDLIVIRASPADAALLDLLPVREGALNSHRVYLIDPLSNAMMFYAADARPKGMLEDMKRLLRLSSIG
jgi:cytochrome oxidase Cu insertion factor (SCO1/SenC/PrrC family)